VLRRPELNHDDKPSTEGSVALRGSTITSEDHAPNGRLMLVTVVAMFVGGLCVIASDYAQSRVGRAQPPDSSQRSSVAR